MSDSIKIQSELDKLNKAVGLYIRACGRGFLFGLQKQSSELGRNLAKEAKGLAPTKGSVRASRLAILKEVKRGKSKGAKINDGYGVHVRPSVYKEIAEKYNALPLAADIMRFRSKGKLKGTVTRKGRRLNLQALAVQRELNLRESGRGFLSHADKLAVEMSAAERLQSRRIEASISRYGPKLGEFAFTVDETSGVAVFKWGGFSELSNDAVKAMGRARGQAAVARAMQATTANMLPYIERKLGEAAVGLLT